MSLLTNNPKNLSRRLKAVVADSPIFCKLFESSPSYVSNTNYHRYVYIQTKGNILPSSVRQRCIFIRSSER